MFRQTYQDIQDDKYKVCCCGHVRKIASIIAIVYIALNIIGILISVVAKPGLIMPSIVGILVYSLALLGDKRSSPGLYIPAIVIHILQAVVSIIVLIVAVIIALGGSISSLKSPKSNISTDQRVLSSLIIILSMSPFIVFSIWCFTIFYRTRTYLKTEIKSRRTTSVAEPNNSHKVTLASIP
ncbi:hypothetical protein FO519_009427 [Halicephalobus sp. NKZ332]|nr:hypothetical protein FO519_009427 [Halicephalobus sp. NKZ332]